MPRTCLQCGHIRVLQEAEFYACNKVKIVLTFKDTFYKRPEWCPLDKKFKEVKSFNVGSKPAAE